MIVNGGDVYSALHQLVDDETDFILGQNEIAHEGCRRTIAHERDPSTERECREQLDVPDRNVQVAPWKAKAHDAARLRQPATSKRLLHPCPIGLGCVDALGPEGGASQRNRGDNEEFTHACSPVYARTSSQRVEMSSSQSGRARLFRACRNTLPLARGGSAATAMACRQHVYSPSRVR